MTIRITFSISITSVLLFLTGNIAAECWARPLPDLIVTLKPSIVGVGTYQRTRSPPALFRGTGFSVGTGHYIATNAHVLPSMRNHTKLEKIAVFVGQGKSGHFRIAKVIAIDQTHDIAILRVGGNPIPALKLGNSGNVREGELYAFTGYPIGMVLGLHPVTHRGIVSAISPIVIPALNSRQLSSKILTRLNDPYNVFQLDATAYPGNSGSPLYNVETGYVVGIINKVFVKETKENLLAKPSGISYAIPVKHLSELMKKNGISGSN